MSDQVQGLIIEIESDVSQASSNLNKLIENLETLRDRMKVSTSIGTFTKNYDRMLSTLSKNTIMDSGKTEALKNFASVVNELNNVKVSESIANQFTRIGTALDGISAENIGKINSLARAVYGIKALGEVKISTSITNGLKKIVAFSDEIKGKDFSKLNELTTCLSKMKGVADSNAKSIANMTTSVNKYSNATKNASQRSRTFNTVLANIKVTTVALVHGFQKVVDTTHEMIGTYGDYIETLNLFEVSMEDSGEAMYAYAKKAQDLLGIDMTQWMKGQGVFMSLGKGFGIATDRAALMSQQLTQLAYDISSFYNIDVSSAIEKVQSGFAGQLKPLRALGFDLSQAKLEAIALSLGIDKSVKSMTQAEKAQLRYMAMLTQVKDVQGDLARTINSPINQLRILQAQLQQLYRSFGMMFLPILNEILPYLMAVLKVIRWIAEEIAAMFGYTLPGITGEKGFGLGIEEDTETMADGFEDATGKAKDLKNTLASFDQINLITSSSGGGSGLGLDAGANGSEWNFDIPTYDFFGDASESKAEQIAKTIREKIQPALDTIKEIVKYIQDHSDEILAASMAIGTLLTAGKVYTGLKGAKDSLKTVLDSATATQKILGGLTIAIVGFSLSFSGGKDLAKGNIAEGIIESVLGVGLAAIGGAIAFGTAGAIITAGLAINFLLFGYNQEKVKEQEERIEGIFYAIDEKRKSVEEFKKTWDDFIDSLNLSDFDTTTIEQTSTKIENIGRSIADLQISYTSGVISAATYVASVDGLFASLEKAVGQYLEETGRMIQTAFENELSVVAAAMGLTDDMMQAAISGGNEAIQKDIQEMKDNLATLGQGFLEGTVTEKEYNQAVKDSIDYLVELGFVSSEVADAVDGFKNRWKDGVNFENLDEGLQLLKDLDASYQETLGKIHETRDEVVSGLERRLQSHNLDPEIKKTLETMLVAANTGYKALEDTLKEGYKNTLRSFEDSTMENWQRVLDTEGLDAAVNYVSDDMVKLNKAIQDNYDSAALERGNNMFKASAELLDQYAFKMQGYGSDLEHMADYEASMADATEEFTNRIKLLTRAHKEDAETFEKSTTEEILNGQRKWVNSLKEQMMGIDEVNKHTKSTTKGLSGEFANMYGMVAKAPKEISNACMQSYLAMIGQKGNFAKAGNELIGQIGNAFGDPNGTLAKKLNGTIGGASSTIGSEANANKFKAAGDKIFGKLKEAFSDPEGKLKANVQNMVDKVKEINGAEYSKKGGELRDKILNPLNKDNPDTKSKVETTMSGFKELLENKLKLGDLGEKEGDAFFENLTDSLTDSINISELQTALNTITNTMRGAFASMGVDVLTYMTKFMGKIADIWNDLEITAGTAKYKGDANVPPKIDMRYLAKGGLVPSGDLFVANENGVAEYVGSMGGKAAVANNEQIINGVSDGVLRALKETGIAGDVKTIAKKSNKVVFAPSEEAGRVMHQSMNMYNPTGGRYS